MHIDYDYYDMLSEQDDRLHRKQVRQHRSIWMRKVMVLFVPIMVLMGIISALKSCA